MFWFIVLLLILGAGFYFYQKLMVIEREIRAEQENDLFAQQESKSPEVVDEVQDSVLQPASEPQKVTDKPAVLQGDDALDVMLLEQIRQQPGIKQTELYSLFPDAGKKQLQQLLKEMNDTGRINREKQGSSYLLFPNG